MSFWFSFILENTSELSVGAALALTMLTSERDELVKRSVSSLFTFSTLVSLSAEITSASTFLPVVSPLSDGCSG